MVAPILVEAAKGATPENFVPVMDWNEKVVWVWVRKPGGKVLGPVEIPHPKVSKYKGKLGWLPQKTSWKALLDPASYSGKEDLFPPDWAPGDSLTPVWKKAPGKKTVTGKYHPPAGAPPTGLSASIPPEFTLTGKKDPNGYPTAEDEGSGETYSLLPGGKIGKWEGAEGVYYIAKKEEGEWDIHLDSPIYKPKELSPGEAPPPPPVVLKPPSPPEVPEPEKPKKPKKSKKEGGVEVPAAPKPPQKFVVSPTPEPPPHLTKYVGATDPNGFPLVDELPDSEDEEELVVTGLTLFPDDRVGKWAPSDGVYLLYDYDPQHGYMYSKAGTVVSVKEITDLKVALSLTVKSGRYHTVSAVGKEGPQKSTYSTPLPGNCELASGHDPNGLPLVLTIPEDKDDERHSLSLLPNSKLGRWDSKKQKYLVWEWQDMLGFCDYYPTHPAEYVGLKEVQKLQVQAGLIQPGPSGVIPVEPEPPPPPPSEPEPAPAPHFKMLPSDGAEALATLKPTGEVDLHGYPTFVVASGGSQGRILSKLPGGIFASWYSTHEKYVLFKYYKGIPPYDSFWDWADPNILGAHSVGGLTLIDPATLASPGTEPKAPVTTPEKLKAPVPTEGMDDFGYPLFAWDGQFYSKLPWEHMPEGLEPSENYFGLPNHHTVVKTGPDTGTVLYRVYQWVPPGFMESWEHMGGVHAKVPFPAGWVHPSPVEEPIEEPVEEPVELPLAAPPTVVTPGALPDPNFLVDIGSAGMKGAGEKTRLRDPETGQVYLFKPAVPKSGVKKEEAFRAKSQEGFATIATIGRPDAAIPVETVRYKDRLGTLQPMLDLDPEMPDLSGVPPEALTVQEQLDVASEHLLDWLMSQHDSFGANLVVTKEGRVVGIDKEQGWKYLDHPEHPDRLDTDYKPNTHLYGEQEPYYNKLWKAFAAGKISFDPQGMKGVLERLESADPKVFERVLEGYADARPGWQGPTKTYERYAFVKKGLSRRATLRADFEKFITEQYEKRTGKKGKFTFKGGWVEEGKVGKQHQTLTHSGRDWVLREFGSKALKPHKDYPEEMILVRVDKDNPVTKVQEFLESIGVPPATSGPGGVSLEANPILGSYYNSVVVWVSDLDKMVTRRVKIKESPDQKFPSYPGVPTYQSAALALPESPPDVEALAEVPKMKLGPLGKDFTLDSDAVEQQTASVQRVISAEGETKYIVHFKLRRAYWEPLEYKGAAGDHTWPLGAYDAEKDALVISPYQGSAFSQPARIFSFGKDTLALLTDGARWAVQGSVYATIRGETPQVKGRLTTMLNALGLGEKIMKNPTAAEVEVYNLSQALWCLSPTSHAGLQDKDFNPKTLRAKLKEILTKSQIDSIRQVQGTVGRGSPMIPGMWKTLGGGTPEKPTVRFVFWTVNEVVPILQSAALGGHERLRAGLGMGKGSSETADMESGGADLTTMRLAVREGSHCAVFGVGSVSKENALIIAPDILDRLDVHMFSDDSYGSTNPKKYGYSSRRGLGAAVRAFAKSGHYTGSAEVCIRRGVPAHMIKRVCAPDEYRRRSILEKCAAVGMTEFNGCPIEDFVVVESNQGSIYEKFLKPLGY